jgi:hypothetical protein
VSSRISAKYSPPQAIRASLLGEHTIVAPGVATCTASAPILELARLLIARGVDPTTALRIYRGDTLALRVRTIGEAAGLQINGKGNGCKKCPAAVGIAPPMRQTGGGHVRPAPASKCGGAP